MEVHGMWVEGKYISPISLRRHLVSLSPNASAGDPWSNCGCPIFQFLIQLGIAVTEVGDDYFIVGDEKIPAPAWMKMFIYRVACTPRRHLLFSWIKIEHISAGRCLAILERMNREHHVYRLAPEEAA